jgi:exo-beta-1,3-glucanase (GH17 family)
MRRALLFSLLVMMGCGSSTNAGDTEGGDGDTQQGDGDGDGSNPGDGDGDGDGDGAEDEPEQVPAETPFVRRKLELSGRAVSYSPYRDGQSPARESAGTGNPSDAQILEDLQILSKNWKVIRTYGAGEVTANIAKVIDDNDLPIKMMVGSWLEPEKDTKGNEIAGAKMRNEEEVQRALTIAKDHPTVVGALSVGNEVLVDWSTHKVPYDRVVYFVRKVRAATKLPVSVADNYVWWRNSGGSLSKEVDFIVIHTYPFWEKYDIDLTMENDTRAIDYTNVNYQGVKIHYPDIPVVIGEAGWASLNSWNAQITPGAGSEEKQKVYMDQLLEWSSKENVLTFEFEAFDENWKGDPNNPGETEKHWGMFKADRTPKLVVQDLYPDLKPSTL